MQSRFHWHEIFTWKWYDSMLHCHSSNYISFCIKIICMHTDQKMNPSVWIWVPEINMQLAKTVSMPRVSPFNLSHGDAWWFINNSLMLPLLIAQMPLWNRRDPTQEHFHLPPNRGMADLFQVFLYWEKIYKVVLTIATMCYFKIIMKINKTRWFRYGFHCQVVVFFYLLLFIHRFPIT